MTNFIYEGNFQGVRQNQLDFISDVLQKLGFKGSTVTIEPLGNIGGSFLANVKRIVVNENGNSMKIIAKFANEDAQFREQRKMDLMFTNEHFMYTEVLSKFETKLKSAKIESKFLKFAKCYGTTNEVPNEVILLEDLKNEDFELMDSPENLTYENLKLVLKSFAVYHSLSFVTRYLEPEVYEDFQKHLVLNSVPRWEESTFVLTKDIEAQTLELVANRYSKVIKGLIANVHGHEKDLQSSVRGSKYTVIQHGDTWPSNIMLRLENKTAVECAPIDFQLACENTPAFDLLFLIFNSTSHEHRQKHFYQYIECYHSELAKSLQKFKLDVNTVYPKERLNSDMKICAKFVFSLCIFLTTLLNKTKDDYRSFTIKDDKSKEMFRTKVEGLADSFVEFDLL